MKRLALSGISVFLLAGCGGRLTPVQLPQQEKAITTATPAPEKTPVPLRHFIVKIDQHRYYPDNPPRQARIQYKDETGYTWHFDDTAVPFKREGQVKPDTEISLFVTNIDSNKGSMVVSIIVDDKVVCTDSTTGHSHDDAYCSYRVPPAGEAIVAEQNPITPKAYTRSSREELSAEDKAMLEKYGYPQN